VRRFDQSIKNQNFTATLVLNLHPGVGLARRNPLRWSQIMKHLNWRQLVLKQTELV